MRDSILRLRKGLHMCNTIEKRSRRTMCWRRMNYPNNVDVIVLPNWGSSRKHHRTSLDQGYQVRPTMKQTGEGLPGSFLRYERSMWRCVKYAQVQATQPLKLATSIHSLSPTASPAQSSNRVRFHVFLKTIDVMFGVEIGTLVE